MQRIPSTARPTDRDLRNPSRAQRNLLGAPVRQRGAIRQLLLGLIALIAVLGLLLVLAVWLLPGFVDTAEIRGQIEEQVRVRTGQEIRIAGELDLTLLPRLALDASDVVLEGSPSEASEIGIDGRIGRAQLRVALLPLLRREISVQGLSLEGVDLEIQDPAQGAHYRASGLTIATGPLRLGPAGPSEPVRVTGQGLIRDLAAELGAHIDLSTEAVLDLGQQVHELRGLQLELTPLGPEEPGDEGAAAQAPSFVLTAPSVLARLAAKKISVESFELAGAELRLAGAVEVSDIDSTPELSGSVASETFSPREVLAALGQEAPALEDPLALQSARFETKFMANPQRAALEGLSLKFDDSTVTGRLAANQLDQPRPQFRFQLSMDRIDMNRYLPVEESPPTAGRTLEPPAEDNPTAAGTPDPTQTPPEPDEGPLTLPIFGLGDRDVQGRLEIAQLTSAGLTLESVLIGVTAQGGVTRFNPFTAGLLGGRYAGDIEIDERGERPVIYFDERIEDIPFAELAGALAGKNELSGTAQGSFAGTGTGFSLGEVLASLDGAVSLELDEGALEGTDLWYEIRSAIAQVRGKPGPEEDLGRTVFTRLGMSGEITDGLLRSDDLALDMPFLTVDGGGELNLATQAIDFSLQTTVRDNPEVNADPLGSELAGVTVPLRLQGPVDDPELELDIENLLRGEATRRILDQLLDR